MNIQANYVNKLDIYIIYMSNPKKVGEGSYGCVHNPPLKCKDRPYNPDPTKVSKNINKEERKQ